MKRTVLIIALALTVSASLISVILTVFPMSGQPLAQAIPEGALVALRFRGEQTYSPFLNSIAIEDAVTGQRVWEIDGRGQRSVWVRELVVSAGGNDCGLGQVPVGTPELVCAAAADGQLWLQPDHPYRLVVRAGDREQLVSFSLPAQGLPQGNSRNTP